MAGFRLSWIWYLAVLSVYTQLTLALLLLRREYGRRLNFEPASETAVAAEPAAATA